MTGSISGKRLLAVMAVTAVMVMAPTLGRADPPTFPVTLSQGTSCQVWDIAGTIIEIEDIPGIGSTTLSFMVATDDKGKVTGTGAWTAAFNVPGVGAFVMDLFDPAAKGKVKSSRVGPPKLKLRSKMKGTIAGEGLVFPTKGVVKLLGEIDAAGDLVGTTALNLKGRGTGEKFKRAVLLDVTPDAANDGTWDLNLNITSADGVNLAGGGNAVMATGYVVDNLIASGKYNATDDLSKVNLKNSTGGKVQLKNLAADAAGTPMLTAGSLKYALLGQKRLVDIATDCLP